MKKIGMSCLVAATCFSKVAYAEPVAIERVTAPAPIQVTTEITATKVVEISVLNVAQLIEPKIAFSHETGYGLTVPAYLLDIRMASNTWICNKFGYGDAIKFIGKKEKIKNGATAVFYAADLKDEHPQVSSVSVDIELYNILECKLK